jgi:hypothetical protein
LSQRLSQKGYVESTGKHLLFSPSLVKTQDPFLTFADRENVLHGSRHKRKHPKGRRKVGQKKRRMMRQRRALRTK